MVLLRILELTAASTQAGEGENQQRQQQYAEHQRSNTGCGIADLHSPYHSGGEHDKQLKRVIYGQQHDHA